jgi:hypothetical protein
MVLYLDAANTKNYNLTAVEVLVVAGGGGGGGRSGGGGGAGGLIYNSNFAVTPGSALTVTVGGGGNGGAGSGDAGSDGGNSIFSSITATGGGGGAGDGTTSGRNGGSGGGGKYGSAGGTGTSGQGFAGGSGTSGTWKAGGGGGAGGVGVNGVGSPHKCGDGGPGLGLNISGTFAYYAGGGGGGSHNSGAGGCCDDVTARAFGGIGGGGNGGTPGGFNSGDNATTNTGGGGGGGSTISGSGGAGGNGGSGIVIVRYPGPQKAIGGTITSNNGYTIHTFTSTGSTTFTPLVATNNSAILGLSDFSGRGNFGTTVNSPTYSSANGGSLSFDGTNDYATISFNSVFNVTSNPFTVIVWNKKNTSTNGFNGLITADTAGDNTWKIYKDNGETYYKCRTGNTILVFPNYVIGQWHMYAFTKSGSTLTNYFDGNLVSSNLSANDPSSFSNNLALGSYRLNDAQSGFYLMDQNFSAISFYNRALTAAEIQQNFNALRSRFSV